MLGAMSGLFARSPLSKAARVRCVDIGFKKISVDPHQIMTSRSAPVRFRNCRMSSITCSARSILVLPFFTFDPRRRFTNFCSKTAGMGLMLSR